MVSDPDAHQTGGRYKRPKHFDPKRRPLKRMMQVFRVTQKKDQEILLYTTKYLFLGFVTNWDPPMK